MGSIEVVDKKRSFRADIQGLRALAVLSVVIFHISPYHLPGGYLGVDIFFVISGYLIIGQLWRSIKTDTFSFATFYANRFKRLLPALLTVLTISSILAFYLLLPYEYEKYVYSLTSSLLYFSNFLFYSQSGYFSHDLELAPLLHTWSLSVEEQFYLLFPFILILISKFTKIQTRALALLMGIAVLSLLASHLLLSIDASLSFFSSPTRFWQFILGGLVAIADKPKLSSVVRNFLVFVSLSVIVTSFFVFDKNTPFPGIYALPITLATVAVILANVQKGALNWLLSNKLSQFFGNTSYSFYLWHWPVIVFYKILFLGNYSKIDQVAVFSISLILAVLTYYLIEEPSRKLSFNNSKKKLITSAFGTSLLVIVVASLFLPIQRDNYPSKVSLYEKVHRDKGITFREEKCFLTPTVTSTSNFSKFDCIKTVDGKTNVLLLGDSHAAMWYSALNKSIPDGFILSQANAAGCTATYPLKGEHRCNTFYTWVLDELIPNTTFDLIIVASRWRKGDAASAAAMVDNLFKHSKHVVLIGPVIEYPYSLPWLLSYMPIEEVQGYARYNKQKHVNDSFISAIESTNADYFPVLDKICPAINQCVTLAENGVPMMFDDDHLTEEGASLLLRNFWRDISEKHFLKL
tara:strand:- start:215 stop:2113 length:1899 start_codon:yes stop_codon:yes gene_type:complete